ncbi:MAG: hypothetical protein Q9195_000419, partial [Heterodermia aff. obscurata]
KLNWALTGVASALSAGRYAIRGYNSRRLYWDDLVHLLALLVLIAHGVTNELSLHSKATIASAKTAVPKPSNARLLDLYQHNQKLSRVNNCFLYLVFWTVKLSFLLLYRILFNTSAPFRKAWWVVLGLTLLTFWVPIAGVLSTCVDKHTVAEYKACNSNGPARIAKLEYSCALNVITDLAIMALPWWMIKDLKIDRFQKIGLALLFSVAIVCVVMDIVRTIEAVAEHQALYTIIEINLVVIISCLPTYRALLAIFRRRKSRRASGTSAWRSLEEAGGSKGQQRDSVPLANINSKDSRKPAATVIQVTNDIDISTGQGDQSPLFSQKAPSRPARPQAGASFQAMSFL